MKNEYLEKICDRIQNGEEVGRNQQELAWAYKQPTYQKFGRICLDHPIHTDKDAAATSPGRLTLPIKKRFMWRSLAAPLQTLA